MSPTSRRDLAFCLAVSLMLLALVWAEPRPIDDLFIALAGGRDVLAGRLGTPDDWSFTTEGRVWLNQNWGSHVLFHLTDLLAGSHGLLALKALLFVVGTWCLAAAARTRAADWPTAVLIAATAFTAGRSYVDLRPNLVGLVLASALLATLGAAVTRPAWLWVAAVLVAVWANAHGSFVFGLGALALFALTVGLVAAPLRLTALGAFIVALLLAAFANPFGTANLTHALVVGTSPAWRTVAEWVPLFANDVTAFGSRVEIVALAAGFVLLRAGRLILGRGEPTPEAATTRAVRGRAVFDAVLIVVVATMAVSARRFVPLALVVLAAPLAADLAWWLRRLASAWPLRLVAAGLAIAVLVAALPIVRRYQAANPVFVGLTTFERMVDAPSFPSAAAAFLRANDIRGRAYAAWETEGFLRWTETPVTVLIGGRAQQIYDEVTLQLHKDLRTGAAAARDALAAYQVPLAILPLTAPYSIPLGQLIYAEDSSWAYIYCDGRHVVLANTAHPGLAETMRALEAGTLSYPTPAIAATSRMMYLASPHTGAELDTVRAAAEEAARLAPIGLAYAVIGDIALSSRSSSAPTRQYLAAERVRLEHLAAERGDTFELAQARLSLARTEAALVGRTVDPAGVQRTREALTNRQNAMRDLLTTWAYGWDPNVF